MSSWKDFGTFEKFEFFQKNDEDCSFLVGMAGKEEPILVKSFKFILTSVSPTFDRMFHGEFLESKSADPVEIDDIFAEDFQTFLKFVYGENPYVKNWRSLYDVADKYMADDFKESICVQLNAMQKSPHEVLQLFEINVKYDKTPSASFSNDLLVDAFRTQCDYMFEMKSDMFFKLIKSVKTYAPMILVFQAINTYFSLERNNFALSHKKQLIKLFLSQVDFMRITATEFLNVVEPSQILDVTTKHKILVDLCRQKPNMKNPTQVGFFNTNSAYK